MSTTTAWAVTFLYAGSPGEDALVAAEDALASAGACLGADAPDRFSLTVLVGAPDPVRAVEAANGLVRGGHQVAEQLGDPPLLGVESLREDEYARRADAPTLPVLLGASEVAALLGVTRQRVHQLATEHPQFPAPLVRVAMGPLWDERAVEAFARSWARTPGRPAAQPA